LHHGFPQGQNFQIYCFKKQSPYFCPNVHVIWRTIAKIAIFHENVVVFTSEGTVSTKIVTVVSIAFCVYIYISQFWSNLKNVAVESLYLELLIIWNKNNKFYFRHFESTLKP
jgi:hypothetical protein